MMSVSCIRCCAESVCRVKGRVFLLETHRSPASHTIPLPIPLPLSQIETMLAGEQASEVQRESEVAQLREQQEQRLAELSEQRAQEQREWDHNRTAMQLELDSLSIEVLARER